MDVVGPIVIKNKISKTIFVHPLPMKTTKNVDGVRLNGCLLEQIARSTRSAHEIANIENWFGWNICPPRQTN